jgi:predicted nucleotidyltransferase
VTHFRELLRRLTEAGVEFVVIGGVAVIAHGHARATLDLDVCYARSPANIRRLVAAIQPIHPHLRGAAPDLPFIWDERTLRNGLNFTLVTDEGDLDLLGEITGLGSHDDIALRAIDVDIHGTAIRLLSLEDLIRSKAAAGRAKDLVDLEALRAIARTRKP